MKCAIDISRTDENHFLYKLSYHRRLHHWKNTTQIQTILHSKHCVSMVTITKQNHKRQTKSLVKRKQQIKKMSLFTLCRWWHTQCPDFASNYDFNSMHCCRIGLNDNDKDYIIVGSHSGHLSVFNPSGDPPENTSDNSFKATDVLIEMKLPNPIIGILSGKFIGYSYTIHLHSRSFWLV